jgi:hypothetical protein
MRTQMDRDRTSTRTVRTFRAAPSAQLCSLHNESRRGAAPFLTLHERPMRIISTLRFTFVLSTRFTSALAHGVRRGCNSKALLAYTHAPHFVYLYCAFLYLDTLVISCRNSRRTVCTRTHHRPHTPSRHKSNTITNPPTW